MRAPRFILLAALAASCASVHQQAQEATTDPLGGSAPIAIPESREYVDPGLSQLNLRFSRLALDDTDWQPIEDQTGFGFEYSRQPAGVDIGWEVGFISFEDDERDSLGQIESNIREYYAGARRTFGHAEAVWRPHLGGGLSVIDAEVENQAGQSDSDWSLGLYLHGGLSAFVTEHLALGLDVRTLIFSKLRLNDETLRADSIQLALTAGWVF